MTVHLPLPEGALITNYKRLLKNACVVY